MRLTLKNIEEYRQQLAAQAAGVTQILVCCGTGCRARGGLDVAQAIEEEIRSQGLSQRMKVGLTRTGCHGWCEQGPIVAVEPKGTFYAQVKVKHAAEVVATLADGRRVESLLYRDVHTKKKIETYHEIPFYRGQTRWAMRNVGRMDPTDLSQALVRGAYRALAKVLGTMTAEEVVAEVGRARLRGRGGAGFDAGRKWQAARAAAGDVKYILCNGDEGDPGAFMDRSIMEADPHGVLEGLIIGAYAVGARQGGIYVRQEYPLAIQHLTLALRTAREFGLLGEDILGTGFCFDVEIHRGGGAFVCGESSALMRSVEGKPGEPRAKYIHATERGLFDKPTVLNNVETLITVPLIIDQGAEAFLAVGTAGSKGTKAFSVVGKVAHNGLIEVPMGTTLRKLIFEVAGGMPSGRTFKAVQTGGPSGGCLPERLLDLPVDFDSLSEAGSMMGSGGLIVMDDRNCMVDVARYFVQFLVDESCGKCVPCREGLRQLQEILDRITAGKGVAQDLALIDDLCFALQEASLCALGRSAANPVLSTVRYFREEYEEHIVQRRCRAGVCRNLCSFAIAAEQCTGCTRCASVCPVGAVRGEKKQPHSIDPAACTRCGSCFDVCNFNAVTIGSAR